MIIGIGTDITSISRIEDLLAEQGERFIRRCFSAEESEYVEKSADKNPQRRAAGYAKRWAAKEAAAKALGLGIRDGIFLKDIVVINDAAGRPTLVMRAGAGARLAELTPAGMKADIQVSLSDEERTAHAFVVISAVAAT